MKAVKYLVQTNDGKIFEVMALNAEQAMDIAIIRGLQPINATKA